MTVIDTKSLLGQGIYSIPDAARIIRADPRSVRRWTVGYHRNQQISHGPVLLSEVATLEGVEFLTFTQLIETLFIALFRKNKIAMPIIRAAAKNAAQLFGNDHPFAVESLRTDGKNIFHLDPGQIDPDDERLTRDEILRDLARGQTVMLDLAEPYFRAIEYKDFTASEYWPMGRNRHVVIDRQRNFGQPIDPNTGVPTNIVYGMYDCGDTPEIISRWYNMDKQAVIDAIEYEQSLLPKAA